MLIEELHAGVTAGNHLREVGDLAIEDLLANHRGVAHHLQHGQSPCCRLFATRQPLTDDRGQIRCQLNHQEFTFVSRKHRHDPLHREGRVGRMHRAKHQVPCIGRLQSDPHRLRIPQLPHQNHVWVLSQRAFQRLRKTWCVTADFTVSDQTLVGIVDKLDGVFDGHNPQPPRTVEMVDHRCQCRTLPTPCSAGDQHQATPLFRDFTEHAWQPQFVKLLDLQWNAASHNTEMALLVKHVDAKPRHVGDEVRKVTAQVVLQPRERGLTGDLLNECANLLSRHWRRIKGHHRSVDTYGGRAPHLHMKVACLELYCGFEEPLHIHRDALPFSSRAEIRVGYAST